MHSTYDENINSPLKNTSKLSSQLPPPLKYSHSPSSATIDDETSIDRSHSPLPPPIKPSSTTFLPVLVNAICSAEVPPPKPSTYLLNLDSYETGHTHDHEFERLRLNSFDALVMNQNVIQPNISASTSDPEIDSGMDSNSPKSMSFSHSRSITRSQSKRSRTKNNIKSSSSSDDDDSEYEDGDLWNNVEDKLIAIINRGSGARKGWILANELRRYNAIIYDLLELSKDQQVVHQLGKGMLYDMYDVCCMH